MKIFETPRLRIRLLKEADGNDYFDMMGNPNVMHLIPREVMTRAQSDKHLRKFLATDYKLSDTKVWAIESKDAKAFIGICAFLKNDEREDEIGYRLREKFWRKGFGTEVTKGLIQFGFEEMKMPKITADVAVENLNSVKILEKFMALSSTFFNASDDCMDARYAILRTNWLK